MLIVLCNAISTSLAMAAGQLAVPSREAAPRKLLLASVQRRLDRQDTHWSRMHAFGSRVEGDVVRSAGHASLAVGDELR